MKFLKLAFSKEVAMPMVGVTFASAVSVALVSARILWTGKLQYAFLIWNLFLAWLPFCFALLACDKYRKVSGRHWHFLSLTGAWILFLPNAPYIFTDLIHLQSRYFAHFWVDMVLILSCALTGLVLSFLSLFLMQNIVRRLLGGLVSWCFVAGAIGLSSFGIYLGRFLRFNSWDIIVQPVKLYHGIGEWVAAPLASSTTFAFPVLFATFLFIAYVMLYALTHLQIPAYPVAREMEAS
jgi:uncharacterized membrane protein